MTSSPSSGGDNARPRSLAQVATAGWRPQTAMRLRAAAIRNHMWTVSAPDGNVHDQVA